MFFEILANIFFLAMEFFFDSENLLFAQNHLVALGKSMARIQQLGSLQTVKMGRQIVCQEKEARFFRCSCHVQLVKNGYCRNSVAVMCREDVGFRSFPVEAIAKRLKPTKSPGRPRKVGPALSRI